jgi:ABC-type polar amino acid transport system ATPase subunit
MLEAVATSLAAPVLSLRAVTRSYKSGDRTLDVLRGVDLDLRPGEVTGLVGPSGSGKSTLLHVAGLLEKPDSGTVQINGKDALKMSDHDRTMARRLQLGFVDQFHHLLPELNAVDHVAAPLMINGMARSRARKRGQELLRLMGLKERDHHRPGQLSGGEQQRVAIARSLAMHPKIMLFDEITSALDPELIGEVLRALERLAGMGMTMILVTHEMGFAKNVANRVAFMHEGEVWEEGPTESILDAPRTPELVNFLGSVLS